MIIPFDQISVQEQLLSDLDLLQFDCPPHNDVVHDVLCKVYSFIHSQNELESFQSTLSPQGFVLEYDPEMTEEITQRQKRTQQGEEATILTRENEEYATIQGHSCFLDIDGMNAWLEDFVTTAPSHLDVSLTKIGESYQKSVGESGYDIQALRITGSNSSSTNTAGNKAPMLILTGVHAREYSPPELVRRWILSLATNDDDDVLKAMLESTEIHWIPYVNPDGRKLAETTQPYRRKNTNPTSGTCGNGNDDDFGVDINRNFPFRWGLNSGSSTNKCSQTFRGESAMSEPETVAVVEYAKSIFPEAQRKDLDDFDLGNSATGYDEDATTGVFLDIHSRGNYYIFVS